jgi:hypothetical protein
VLGEYAAIAVRAAAAARSSWTIRPTRSLADDAHHLGRVLRLRAGEEVIVSDGAGHWARTLWRAPATAGARSRCVTTAGPGGDGACSSRRRLDPP